MTSPCTFREAAIEARAKAYAAKFAAETIHYDPPQRFEPTDANLAAVLRTCCRPPALHEYETIRDTFTAEYGTGKEWD